MLYEPCDISTKLSMPLMLRSVAGYKIHNNTPFLSCGVPKLQVNSLTSWRSWAIGVQWMMNLRFRHMFEQLEIYIYCQKDYMLSSCKPILFSNGPYFSKMAHLPTDLICLPNHWITCYNWEALIGKYFAQGLECMDWGCTRFFCIQTATKAVK